jgi:plastocyanin
MAPHAPLARKVRGLGLCLTAVIAAGLAPPAGTGPHGSELNPRRAGSIEGVVTRQQRPQRRVASRYPAGAPAPQPLQEVPTVAYLDGDVAGEAAPRTLQIAQQDSTFVPAAVAVPVGSTVAFPNRDPIFHNVFSSSSPKRFNLGRYPQGESKSVVFDQPGVVKVYCEVHDHMRSAVVVVENPYYAVVGADGRFRIENVPAGRHTLVIWHMDSDPQEVEVTVPENGVARVQVTLG